MFRALNNSPKFKGILQIQDLANILNACKKFAYPLLFQTLYLFAFFGFFRISNLVPTSTVVYNLAKHLSRNDVFVVSDGLVVLVKWSKTMQASNQGSYVILPRFNRAALLKESFQYLKIIHFSVLVLGYSNWVQKIQ